MKPTAIGRILFWRQGSLWIGLAGEPSGSHAHHAVQITLPFPGCQARLQRDSEEWKTYSAAIVAANERHEFEARGQHIAQIFLDPQSNAGRALQLNYQAQGIAALNHGTIHPLITALAHAYETRASDEKLIELAEAVITTLAGAASKPATSLDTRIEQALQLIRKRLGGPIALEEIAAEVHLSPDRFRHLFMKEMRVTFRAYLLWLRLDFALTTYVAGSNLTEAAHAGGFADSAHFSRTFRKMFGIAPVSVRPE